MANAKQVLDVQVSKGITAAQGNEHLRNRSKEAEKYAMSKGNYDPTRKHLNFEIASGGKIRPIDTSRNIPERMADILGRRGQMGNDRTCLCEKSGFVSLLYIFFCNKNTQST